MMVVVHDVRVVLTDIEGTTSSLAFVTEVLFPYARARLPAYVRDHRSELGDIARQIRALEGADAESLSAEQMTGILLQWMDQDRKVTPLKALQGMIWRTGFERGELRGHVYEDAVQALRAWRQQGLRLYIYSSGSVDTQRLLFAHTPYGDLGPLLSGYFDTTTGPKLEAYSYQLIAGKLGCPAHSVVFLSDHAGELRAAASAGMQTVLLARDPSATGGEGVARSFHDITLSGPSDEPAT
jgi:enolase-phosphatase E1